MWEELIWSITDFASNISWTVQNIANAITNVWWFILSLFWFLRYWVKTLITWIWKLLYYLSWSWVWADTSYVIGKLSTYIWPWWSLFLLWMLTIIIIRILYWFVHKMIFRPDYKMSNSRNWEPTDIVEDRTYPRLPW